jgi:hypothetical protein
MLDTRMNLVRTILLVAFGSALGGCGDTGTAEPREASYVYCANPDAAAVSCTLPGYTLDDDSGLRAKLESCATVGCHGMGGVPAATTWTLDLSGSVEDALSGLTTSGVAFLLIDDEDPDCSQMLAEVTSKPIGLVRMPNTGNPADYWTSAEADCFRSYLHELFPQ